MNTEEIINKLNSLLGKGTGEHDVSPTSTSGRGASTLSSALYIHKDINVDVLSKNNLLLLHVMLHKFFSAKNKSLRKDEIIKLHRRVSQKINHSRFDKLDDTV